MLLVRVDPETEKDAGLELADPYTVFTVESAPVVEMVGVDAIVQTA
jgi:hypothetical protein